MEAYAPAADVSSTTKSTTPLASSTHSRSVASAPRCLSGLPPPPKGRSKACSSARTHGVKALAWGAMLEDEAEEMDTDPGTRAMEGERQTALRPPFLRALPARHSLKKKNIITRKKVMPPAICSGRE